MNALDFQQRVSFCVSRARTAPIVVLAPLPAWSQDFTEAIALEPEAVGEGWAGFTDIGFMLNALLMLLLAAGLGALMSMQPRHGKTADSIEELETPQIYTIYAVVGAIVGIMVVKYGLVVGFVLFGIGGLIRFRTVLRSPTWTGRVILVTLIGLSCGLNLPHIAVLSAAFGWVLTYFVDSRVTYRLQINGIDPERFNETATAYRMVLGNLHCRMLREKKNPGKNRVTYVFRCPQDIDFHHLEEMFTSRIDPELRATADWEVD
jgi:hypothetical protein